MDRRGFFALIAAVCAGKVAPAVALAPVKASDVRVTVHVDGRKLAEILTREMERHFVRGYGVGTPRGILGVGKQ